MGKCKPKKVPPKRICKVCGARLSVYNTGKECFCHSKPARDASEFDRRWVLSEDRWLR